MQNLFNKNLSKILSKRPRVNFIVSLSGGVDSMVSLNLLKNFSDTVTEVEILAVHVNHNIDKEDDEWEYFCNKQCEKMGVKLIKENIFINGGAAIDGIARTKRYRAIGKHSNDETLVITGHHANDNAESLLLSLQHGTGLDGLCGIRTIRAFGEAKGELYRPLLVFTKNQITHFAEKNHISWVEDPSNSKPIYARNKVRINLIPQMVENSDEGVIHRISNTTKVCELTLDAMNELIYTNLNANPQWDGNDPSKLPVSSLISETTASFVIRYWLRKNGLIQLPSSALINNMIGQVFVNFKPHHKPVVKLSGGIVIKRTNNSLIFTRTL